MNKKSGFTLVEIMIVVAIIGLLAAIAIPSFVKARNQSQTNACINNLRQMDAAKDPKMLKHVRQELAGNQMNPNCAFGIPLSIQIHDPASTLIQIGWRSMPGPQSSRARGQPLGRAYCSWRVG